MDFLTKQEKFISVDAILNVLGILKEFKSVDETSNVIKLNTFDCPGYVNQDGYFTAYYTEIKVDELVKPTNPDIKNMKAIVYVKNGTETLANVRVWLFKDIQSDTYDFISKDESKSLNDLLTMLAWSVKFNMPSKLYVRAYIDVNETRYVYIELDHHSELDNSLQAAIATNEIYMFYKDKNRLVGDIKWLPNEETVLYADWHTVFFEQPYIHVASGNKHEDLNNQTLFNILKQLNAI